MRVMPRAVCGPAPYSARPRAPRIRRRAPAGDCIRARHTFRYGGGIRGRIMRGGGMPPMRANLIRPGIMKAPRACRAGRIRAFPVRGLAARPGAGRGGPCDMGGADTGPRTWRGRPVWRGRPHADQIRPRGLHTLRAPPHAGDLIPPCTVPPRVAPRMPRGRTWSPCNAAGPAAYGGHDPPADVDTLYREAPRVHPGAYGLSPRRVTAGARRPHGGRIRLL